MMTVDIRIFRSDDHARARALWEQDPGVGLSSADSFENIARFLERNREMSLVALDDDALIATILCGHDGRRGLIHHLAAAPAYRRRGIARSLVDRALAALRREGIQKCHLLVFNDNQSGHAFWRSIGAEERTTLGLFSLST